MGHPPVLIQLNTRFRIILASATLSATAHITFGLGVPMSSLARRTAAMMEAAMTSVDAKRSRCFSSFSRAMALRISPITSPV